MMKCSEHTQISTPSTVPLIRAGFFFRTKLLFAFHFFKKRFKKKKNQPDFSLVREPFEAAQIAFEVKIEESFWIRAPFFLPKNQGAELGEKFISWNRRPRDTREQNGTKMEVERSWGANQRHWMETLLN